MSLTNAFELDSLPFLRKRSFSDSDLLSEASSSPLRSAYSSSKLTSLTSSSFSTNSSLFSSNSDISSIDEIKKIISLDSSAPSFLLDDPGILSSISGPTRNRSINDFRDVTIKKGGTDASVCIPSEKAVVRKFQQGNGARELLLEGMAQLDRSSIYSPDQIKVLNETSSNCYRVGIELPLFYDISDTDSLLSIYDQALSVELCPTVFQDLKKVFGEDGLPFILASSEDVLRSASCNLATLLSDNLILIAENMTSQKGFPKGSELVKNALQESFLPPEKWLLSCQKLSTTTLVSDRVLIEPGLYNLITGSIIDKAITINPIEEIHDFFHSYSWDCPVVGYWMNGDANISNIMFDVVDSSDIKITFIDGKPPKKADWLVDISKCIYSLLGGALIFNKELNLHSLPVEKLNKLRQFKDALLVELDKNSFLDEVDPNWKERATFFAIAQFIRDCRVAFNTIEKLEQEKFELSSAGFVFEAAEEDPDLQALDAEILAQQNRIQTNYTFAAALIHEFKGIS